MSILINGMEMLTPKLADMATVYDAYVLVRPNGHATIVVDNEDGLDSTEYPLVPVPEHGRLIDADALMEQCDGDCYGCPYDTCMARALVAAAPTIIPKEGE